MGLGRFELPTSRLSGVRSNQLSYRPSLLLEPKFLVAAVLFGLLVKNKLLYFYRSNSLISAQKNRLDGSKLDR
jgi:hypothetical protein